MYIFILGADDVEQLKELNEEEFEQLSVMIGMKKKPFHILRFKKALTRHSSTPKVPVVPNDSATPTPNSEVLSSSSSTTNFSNHSLISLPWQLQNVKTPPTEQNLEECPLGLKTGSASSTPGPSRAFLEAMEACGHSLPSTHSGHSSSSLSVVSPLTGDAEGERNEFGNTGDRMATYYLPPYLHETSKEKDFSALLDDHTPIQKTLRPPPFHPSMWDLERKELVRKYSSVYGKNKRQKELLTPFEEQVNEGAYQLCLRDPTLLVRREELFALAKKALKEGGYYSHGYSKNKDLESTIATTGQKRLRNEDRDVAEQNHVPVVQTISSGKIMNSSSLTDDLPKKLSGRMRQEKMVELGRLISSNKSQQAAKLVELEKAQQLGHFSAAFSIQLEVESLGNTCHQLQSNLAALKRKQRRSERYYNLKARENGKSCVGAEGGSLSLSTADGRSRSEVSPSSGKGYPDISDDDDDMVPGSEYERYDHGSSKKFKAVHSPATGHPTVTAQVIPKSKAQPHTASSQSLVGMPGNSSPDNNNQDVQDLVKNVTNATDEVNSLMIREFQKQLEWDL